jgi:hypothetical protein
MTVKQLAQRMGTTVSQLDFSLGTPCKDCKQLGGINEPCEECVVVAAVSVEEKRK